MTTPLADTHVHLLAGLDDGPRDLDEAVALCRALVADGVRFAAATAHQNPIFPDNTAARLCAAATELADTLRQKNVPLTLFPTGEAYITETLPDDLQAGLVQPIGENGKYLLAEMPHWVYLDPRPIAESLRPLGVRLVIAHAERYPEMLHDPELTAACAEAGCLIQVTVEGLVDAYGADLAAVRTWARWGLIHLLGSDGHRIDGRRPRLKEGFRVLESWLGTQGAERIAGLWNTAVLQGLPVNVPPPTPPKKRWFTGLFGV
ncbi:MAG: protein tyrosine phosphatase [Fimbriiglobus sp.]|jgi:protein-tyrosine phosphatase|nr:protein tyrosine phosphatase [Fimbriiglobus sp.]